MEAATEADGRTEAAAGEKEADRLKSDAMPDLKKYKRAILYIHTMIH